MLKAEHTKLCSNYITSQVGAVIVKHLCINAIANAIMHYVVRDKGKISNAI